jgi:hypothetical protein
MLHISAFRPDVPDQRHDQDETRARGIRRRLAFHRFPQLRDIARDPARIVHRQHLCRVRFLLRLATVDMRECRSHGSGRTSPVRES